jgi:uncharacterized protein YndB with AHSA1/START domain
MIDIIHRVGIKAPAANVYAALSTIEGVAGWWTRETTGVSRPGGNIDVRFRASDGSVAGGMNFDVVALEADRKVHWRCRTGPQEWLGTDVTFELSPMEQGTIVLFGHRNWREAVEFTAHCSMKWAIFMMSLKALVETGQGRPSPDDVKIDNWN